VVSRSENTEENRDRARADRLHRIPAGRRSRSISAVFLLSIPNDRP